MRRLSQNLKTTLRKFNFKLLKSLGISFANFNSLIGEESFYIWLSKLDIPINVIYDIGANNGSLSMKLKKIFPKSEFILFEANSIHIKSLELSRLRYFIVVLYKENKLLPFYNLGKTGDSIYKENNLDAYDSLKPLLVQATTLNEFVSENELPIPDLMKLDTQGSELDILQGGVDLLSQVSIIVLEVPILNYNHGAHKIEQIFNFMQDNSFIPIKLVESHIVKDCLVQMDIAFMRLDTINKVFGKKNRAFTSLY